MKHLLIALGLVALIALGPVATVGAAIHPIVASFCAAVANTNVRVLDPPGQTPLSPDPNEWTVSQLRALQATGFLTLVRDAEGNVIGFVIDENIPAVKSGDFPAFARCPAMNP